MAHAPFMAGARPWRKCLAQQGVIEAPRSGRDIKKRLGFNAQRAEVDFAGIRRRIAGVQTDLVANEGYRAGGFYRHAEHRAGIGG